MFRILDRYLVREIVMPFFLGLAVLTFILEIPADPHSRLSSSSHAASNGRSSFASWRLLLPQALCLTIPMAVLLGILVGFGRLSADREFVAMQACGVSLMRLARPVLLVAGLGTIATAYETIVALPDANQTYREIVLRRDGHASREQRQAARVLPGVSRQGHLRARDAAGGGWRDVFLADTSRTDGDDGLFRPRGTHPARSRRSGSCSSNCSHGTSHTTHTDKPDDYEEASFESSIITLDPDTVFTLPPRKGRAR